MNHLTAVHLDNGWHYATTNRRGGGPIGYCADHAPHPTEAEARQCYGTFQRDHVRLDVTLSNWSDCGICSEPAKTGARIEHDGYALVPLCGAHLTTEQAILALGLTGPAGDSWQS